MVFGARLTEFLRTLFHADASGSAVSHEYLQNCVCLLLTLGLLASAWVKSSGTRTLTASLRGLGVHARRLARTANEIERKTFHLSGLGVPLFYQYMMGRGWNHSECCQLAWLMCAATFAVDGSRLYVPFVRDNWPLKNILREKEQHQLTGTCYYGLGCTLAINMFSPAVACCGICFLVVGDMAAALIGVAYGGEVVSVKLGREGKKSLEGSLAMCLACMIIGNLLFMELPLREYAVTIGAVVATVVELYEPFGLNDNLMIPVFSGLALSWGFARLEDLCPTVQALAVVAP